jgi:hypothetical protein
MGIRKVTTRDMRKEVKSSWKATGMDMKYNESLMRRNKRRHRERDS